MLPNRIEWCKLRIEGKTYREIADMYNVSTQLVCNFFSRFPEPSTDYIKPIKINQELAYRICEDYLSGCKPELIASAEHIDSREVYDILYCFRAPTKRKIVSEYYPKVAEWLNNNNYTIKAFAKEININPNTFGAILSGKYGKTMNYEIAQSISTFTGLPFNDIYEYQIRCNGGK